MKIFLAIVLLIATILLVTISSHQSDAMQECERMYSYDVCFDLLNN